LQRILPKIIYLGILMMFQHFTALDEIIDTTLKVRSAANLGLGSDGRSAANKVRYDYRRQHRAAFQAYFLTTVKSQADNNISPAFRAKTDKSSICLPCDYIACTTIFFYINTTCSRLEENRFFFKLLLSREN
jgi:hypothetical protein